MATLCEICNQAEATVHLCEVHHVAGKLPEEQQSMMHEYCEGCFRKQEPVVEIPQFTGSERCCYCGGLAVSAAPNVGPALKVRGRETHWTCRKCDDIEMEFMRSELPKVIPGLSGAKGEEAIEELYRRADAFVLQTIQRGAD
jgi:hypothetical protein